MSNYFQTTHPTNGYDVTVEYDEDKRLVNAVYDNDEDVELTPSVKAHLQADIDNFVQN